MITAKDFFERLVQLLEEEVVPEPLSYQDRRVLAGFLEHYTINTTPAATVPSGGVLRYPNVRPSTVRSLPAAANYQTAPFPDELDVLVAELQYKPGWHFSLGQLERGQSCGGLTLSITIETINSYEPHETLRVAHLFPVPPAAYDGRSWQRWLFEQIRLVESHEAAEFFTVAGAKPYAPSHGPGNDPYLIREVGTDEDRRTSFRGVLS